MDKIQSANKMGTEPVLKLLVSMSVPAIFSMIIQSLYNIVDSIFVAQIGENALTAVSLAFPLQMLLVAVSVGTGVGINSLVARKLGEGRSDEASSAATHGLILAFISWIVFLLIGFLFTKTYFNIYTNDPVISQMGIDYTSCVLIFSIGVFLEIAAEKTIQATGNMILPMISMLIGAVLNIILDPLLIFGIGFFPEMGVLGAAVATVIGQIVAMIVSIIFLTVKTSDMKVSFKGFHFSGYIVKSIYSVGVPAIIMQSISSIMIFGMNAILIGFSNSAVSVLGVYYKLQSLVFMPVFGLTQGVMPIIGYNYGAGKKHRFLNTLFYGCIIGGIIMAIGTLAFWIFPKELLMLFNATDDMLNIGINALRTISLCFIPATIGILFSTLFQAIGKGFRSMLMSILRQLVVILPVAYFLSKISLDSVWYAFPIAEIVSLSAAILLYVNLLHGDFKRFDEK